MAPVDPHALDLHGKHVSVDFAAHDYLSREWRFLVGYLGLNEETIHYNYTPFLIKRMLQKQHHWRILTVFDPKQAYHEIKRLSARRFKPDCKTLITCKVNIAYHEIVVLV